MNIDPLRSGRLNTGQQTQIGDKSEVSKGRSDDSNADKATLSNALSGMATAIKASPEIDASKVSQIADAIARGEFKPDLDRLAGILASEEFS
jgi:flagellar biosynthesis anti-sigma factor FlgM